MAEFLNRDLFALLEAEAKEYRKRALRSIARNRHMNSLTRRNIGKLKKHKKLFERTKDALLVDFINHIARRRGGDRGLCVKYLDEEGC
jgi:hypothetical protein